MHDLMLSLGVHQPKYYHPGFGPSVTPRNLGKANEKRSYKIFEEFRKHKGGIKLHTLYDVKTSIPDFMHVSKANGHAVHTLDLIAYEPGSFYVMDKQHLKIKSF